MQNSSPEFLDHEGVRIAYRPALSDEVFDWQRQPATNGSTYVAKCAALILKHLTRWGVADRTGEILPLDIVSVKRLPEPLLNFIVDAICGYGPKESADAKN